MPSMPLPLTTLLEIIVFPWYIAEHVIPLPKFAQITLFETVQSSTSQTSLGFGSKSIPASGAVPFAFVILLLSIEK